MENKEKLCPFTFSNPYGNSECEGRRCEFWCEFANECAIPLLAGMFADSTVCQTMFKEESL